MPGFELGTSVILGAEIKLTATLRHVGEVRFQAMKYYAQNQYFLFNFAKEKFKVDLKEYEK